MSGKGKRRREARRRARQRSAEQRVERPPQEEDVADAAGSPEEGPSRPGGERLHAAAPEAGHGRAPRKRSKRRAAPWVSRLRVSPWLIATPVVAIGVGVLAFLILSSGSSGVTGGGTSATPTPDPRVAGLPIDTPIEITAGDDGANPASSSFFQPDSVTADAGDVIEFVVTNTGSVTHNIWVAGPDNEYETDDDFGPIELISPGETGRLVVTIDGPGTYLFRCEIHPDIQIGELILE